MTDEQRDLSLAFLEHEKAAVREQLRVFMREHPPRLPAWMRLLGSFERTVYSPRFQFVSATLAILLVGGTGTAFAAQSALPGEPLYGVKVNIEEPIVGALATSPQAKANWSADLAARRLSEAEQLAVQNKLTPAAATTVASGFDQAAENFDVSVAQLATSSNNATAVATLASNMEASIAANTQVLSEIANAVPDSASALKPILASAEERTASLNSARTALDMTAAQTNSEQVKIAAQTALGNAESQISEAVSNSQSDSSSTSSATVLQVQEAQQQLDSGQQNLNQGNYGVALESLQAASVDASAAQLNISIGAQLGTSTNLGSEATGTSYIFPTSPATTSASTSTSVSATSSTSSVATTTSIHIFHIQRSSNRT